MDGKISIRAAVPSRARKVMKMAGVYFREQRNGLTLSEAFAAQHPQVLRRSRLISARKGSYSANLDIVHDKIVPLSEHTKSCQAEPLKQPKVKFPEDQQRLKGQERNSRIKMYQKVGFLPIIQLGDMLCSKQEVLDQIRDHESSRHRSSSKHSPTRPWK